MKALATISLQLNACYLCHTHRITATQSSQPMQPP